MRRYPYVSVGNGLPPAPIVPVTIAPPDWATNSGRYEIEAFLDTGSDCTLIPLEVLSVLQLKIVETDVPIFGVGGGQVKGIACYLNIEIDGSVFRAIRAYGCPGERLNQRVLVGRDVLNQCRVEFDGPNLQILFR
jgi:hypothetical protein